MTDRELVAELVKRLEKKRIYSADVNEERYVDLWDGWEEHIIFEFDEEGNFLYDCE